AEMQRVLGRLGRGDLVEFPVVEGVLEAQLGADAHVPAGRRDPQRRLEVGPVDHFPGVRALDPEVLGGVALGERLAHARRDLGQPAAALAPFAGFALAGFGFGVVELVGRRHQPQTFSAASRAECTALAKAPAVSRTFAVGGWFNSNAAAISSTRAEPT